MLAAAAVPLKNIVGSDQNGEGNAYSAIVASENIAIAGTSRSPAHWLSASATPTIRIGTAACRRRSPVLSECHADASIAGTAASHGMAEISVTWKLLNPDMRCTIFGSQTDSPVLLVI